MPSSLKKEHSALRKMKFINFFLLCGSFLPSWIRIQSKFEYESGSTTLEVLKSMLWIQLGQWLPVLGTVRIRIPVRLREGKNMGHKIHVFMF
jgi:hypothetical protein